MPTNQTNTISTTEIQQIIDKHISILQESLKEERERLLKEFNEKLDSLLSKQNDKTEDNSGCPY